MFLDTHILAEVVCLAGMDRRPESLKHLPCYLFNPRDGVPGTVGVFQPADASRCDAMLASTNSSDPPVAEACWELQYGDIAAAYSDDQFYDKLHLAKVALNSSSDMDGHVPLLRTDRGPFRCEDLQWFGQVNCPPPSPMLYSPHQNESWLSCADLWRGVDDQPIYVKEAVCASFQLSDLGFGTKEEVDYSTLYELGSTVPIDRNAYFRTLCPETCANWISSARRGNARRTLGEELSIDNRTGDHTLAFNSSIAEEPGSLFANPLKFNSPRSGAPATLPASDLSVPVSRWWLGGVLKEAAARDESQRPVPKAFAGDTPWLCLEDILVNSSQSGLLSTFSLGPSQLMAGTWRGCVPDPSCCSPPVARACLLQIRARLVRSSVTPTHTDG
jgi:hypothetical protein